MCMYIGIEDLAANALYELLKSQREGFVRFADLIDYGTEVVKILKNKKVEAVLLFSKERTFHVFEDCSQFFTIETRDNWEGIALKEGVTPELLATRFLVSLSDTLLDAMQSNSAVSKFKKAA